MHGKDFKKGDLVDIQAKNKKGKLTWYCGEVVNVNPQTRRIMSKALNKKIPVYWRYDSHHRKCVCEKRTSKGLPVNLVLSGISGVSTSTTGIYESDNLQNQLTDTMSSTPSGVSKVFCDSSSDPEGYLSGCRSHLENRRGEIEKTNTGDLYLYFGGNKICIGSDLNIKINKKNFK